MKKFAPITHHARIDLTDVLSIAGMIFLGYGFTYAPVL
jgi:hypothetical protein